MGIPKFFRYITEKYPNIITDDVKTIDNLFFDLNCLIHPVVQQVIKNNPQLVFKYNVATNDNLDNVTLFEKKIYIAMEEYINYIISFCNPKKLIYFAIDGVAPRSKMKQQRSRRFRSILEKKMRKEINKKYNKEVPFFDSNCITPGTIFMKKLAVFLRNFLTKNKKTFNATLILSDSGIKGEGEHKILQYMKKNSMDDINLVYGLDADLIMLNLVNNCQHTYLLREAIHYGKVDTENLLYFNIDLFKEKLYDSIKSPLLIKYTYLNREVEEFEPLEINKDNILKDYITLCFLIGNDFLPPLPGIDINNKSIDMLLGIYIDIFSIRQKYLINEDHTLNFIFLKQIIIQLYDKETQILESFQKKKERYRPRLDSSSKHSLEVDKLKFYPIFNKTPKNFKYNRSDWRDNYYKHHFFITNHHKNKKTLHAICQNYIDGLQWNAYYYFSECVSYSWYYKHLASPTLKDLCSYFTKRTYPPTFTDINFTPLEQLSIVLPKESQHLWCKGWRDLSNTNEAVSLHYPIKYSLDTNNKIYLHECEPILSDISNTFIKEKFSNIVFSDLEKKLNEETNLFII